MNLGSCGLRTTCAIVRPVSATTSERKKSTAPSGSACRRPSPFPKNNTVAQAIKPEADTLCAASFRQICSQPVSPGFKAIYEADKRAWINAHPERQRSHDEFDITLETITNRQRQRRITKWSDYRRLVASICDGKEPDADEIATVLADNERTLDELRHDAELLARRRSLRDEYDAIEPLESEATKLAKQIDIAEQTLEAMCFVHDHGATARRQDA